MGGNWYSRSKKALFEVEKPLQKLGIGVDNLPEDIRNSKILTGNDLGKLGNIERIPNAENLKAFSKPENYQEAANDINKLHEMAHQLLEENKIMEAWKVLLKV